MIDPVGCETSRKSPQAWVARPSNCRELLKTRGYRRLWETAARHLGESRGYGNNPPGGTIGSQALRERVLLGVQFTD
jgi:hypothetical protein